jgi:hypothetical protein
MCSLVLFLFRWEVDVLRPNSKSAATTSEVKKLLLRHVTGGQRNSRSVE